MKTTVDELIKTIHSIVNLREDQDLIAMTLDALDNHYELSRKMAQEPGVKDIILQLTGRIYRAYGAFTKVKSKRILDIACGSNTSKAPSFVFVDTPFGEKRFQIPSSKGYTAQFEPWFCRILLELNADPVGVDFGSLDGELFEHYSVDLGQPGGLNLFPDGSFDAIQDSRLFGSPEFTAQFPNQADRFKIADEIYRQEQRLLKPNGIIIHSDAASLLH